MTSKTLFLINLLTIFSFSVQASAANVAPEFSLEGAPDSPDSDVDAGVPYSYQLDMMSSVVSDQNGDTVAVVVENLPSWLTFSALYLDTSPGDDVVVSTWAQSGITDLSYPKDVAVDANFNGYIVDGGSRVFKVSPAGVVSVLAGTSGQGSADGTGSSASFGTLSSVAVDTAGNVYVTDSDRVRKISPDSVVTTLASGLFMSSPGADAKLATDTEGNVYVVQRHLYEVLKISPYGIVTTLAGSGTSGSEDGIGSAASFSSPRGVAVDTEGNVYVADANTIRKISSDGVVTTLVDHLGSSTSTEDIAVDASGYLYVSQSGTGGGFSPHRVLRISPSGLQGVWGGTFAGGDGTGFVDGQGENARFDYPAGLAVDAAGNVYVADSHNDAIRRITPLKYTLSGTPDLVDVGAYDVVFKAHDGNGEAREEVFSITVNTANIAPEFDSLPPTEVDAGLLYVYSFTISDQNGDSDIFVEAVNPPSWLTLSGSKGDSVASYVLSGTPNLWDTGRADVTLKANDQSSERELSFVITINQANVAPEFSSTPVTEVESDMLYSYHIRTSDADGDEVTVTAETLPGWLVLSADQQFIVINEFMASNDVTFADPQGEYDDWIELYNPTALAIDLGGMYLTDDLFSPRKWQFPDTTLAANGYLLVWADDDEGDMPGLHAGFTLSGDGEQIGLFDRDDRGNALVDTLTFGEQESDVSAGRIPDGTGFTVVLETATPGLANSPDLVSVELNWTGYVLSGTPTAEDAGDHDVVLRADDGKGGVTEQSFVVTATLYSPTPDFNGDGAVDFTDFLLFSSQWGKSIETDLDFDRGFDLDKTGDIGFGDFIIFAYSFGS